MDFILVHDASNGASPVIINKKNIISIEKSEILTGASYIQLNHLDADLPARGFHVTEAPEQIFEMLK